MSATGNRCQRENSGGIVKLNAALETRCGGIDVNHGSGDGSLSASEVIGRGLASKVYAYGTGGALKLYESWMPRAKVEREFRTTQIVHQAGLPTPAAYEVVEIEGCLGIVFERLHGISMFRELERKPWRLLTGARRFAALHAALHQM